jgi:hypothetical protein
MRKPFLMTMLLGAACGSSMQTVEPTPRPSPDTGGYQATQPKAEGWVPLGDPVQITPIQQTIYVSGHGGNIGQLLVQGVSGEAEIHQIQIEYMDKGVKNVEVQRRFQPGDGQVIELRDDRPINKIIVFTDPDSQGTFEIFGA